MAHCGYSSGHQDWHFVENSIWMLGYDKKTDPKQHKQATSIKAGDRIAIKRMKGPGETKIQIRHIGIVRGIVDDTRNVVCSVDWVATNIPTGEHDAQYKSRYTNKHERLKLFFVDDAGPITKLIYTLQRIADASQWIITVDDDHIYHADMLAEYNRALSAEHPPATKTTIGPEDNPYLWPRLAQTLYQQRQYRPSMPVALSRFLVQFVMGKTSVKGV